MLQGRGFRGSINLVFVLLFVGCGSDNQSNHQPIAPADEGKNKDYIVVFKNTPVQELALKSKGSLVGQQAVKLLADSLQDQYRVRTKRLFFNTIPAVLFTLDEKQVARLNADPNVAYIEEDHWISVNNTQADAPWGLDRLDQVDLPLDQQFAYPNPTQNKVNVYVIDTGVLTSHKDFEGRANHGLDAVDSDSDSTDCNGHGTHVAGTIAGKTYGVAKFADVYGVRVLNCAGSGRYSDVIAGVEWVNQNHKKPAVANMSLGGPPSQALDQAVQSAIDNGVTFVVAAGNESRDACLGSPARIPEAITVGSSTRSDQKSSFSNYGSCLDLFAPGSNITSAWWSTDSATNTISGTSMAAPHVAGAAALYLSQHPKATPKTVASALITGGLSGKISNPGTGSSNLLLNTQFLISEPDIDPDQTILSRGDLISDLRGEYRDELRYVIKAQSNSKNLTIKTSGGLGDVDLYVRVGAEPSLFEFDCRPYRWGNSETCNVQGHARKNVYVLLRGYNIFSGVQLSVD